MDPAHFGLKKSLFDVGIAHDAAVFRCAKREPITANLAMALTSPNAIVTLSGTAGVGKTTLISSALRASTTRLALAWLNGMPTNSTELLELLLVELGLSDQRATRIERLQIWRQFLSEMSATASRVFVVVERTEDLAPEVLRALDALTAADTNGCSGANVVLLGNEGLDEHLTPPLLESLRQRIRLRQRLEPFSLAELDDYLRHHVTHAGGKFEQLFAPGSVAALHKYSAGIARVVNNLCDTTLTLAASEGKSQVTAELIAATAVDWFGCTPDATRTPTPREPSAVAQPEPITAKERTPATPAAAVVAIAAVPTAPTLTAPVAPAPAPTPVTPAAPTAPAIAATPAVQSPAQPQPLPSEPSHEPAARAELATADADFDGGATDIPEVAMTDFPVLTDAVEELPAAPLPPRARAQAPIAAPTPAPVAPPTPAAAVLVSTPLTPTAAPPSTPPPPARSPVAAPPPAARTGAPATAAPAAAMPRFETAYVPKRAAAATAAPASAKPAPATAKPAASIEPAAPKAATPQATMDEADEDALHQTQTMRALSIAKSIDDISSSMAETLFGEADLDMLSAALASAGWSADSDEDTATATPAAAIEPAKPRAPAPVDDPFDLFDLGPDAPLELIDDSEPPHGQSRKIATQR